MNFPHNTYQRRIVDDELKELIGALPALSIEGMKGAGKTASARKLSASEIRLDSPQDLELVQADPRQLLRGAQPRLIDEWQLYPSSWDLVRRDVDDDPSAGKYILTGSASIAGAPTHTGAARIVPVRMRPLSLAERGIATSVSLSTLLAGDRPQIEGATQVDLTRYVDEIVGSGLPGLQGLAGRPLRAQLDGYLDRIIDREFPEQGMVVRHPDTLRAWMRAYAAATSTTSSFEVIRDAATPGVGNKPAKTTTMPWRDILSRLWMLDPVPAWLPSNNQLKRLGSTEKHHLADPAFAARLLGLTAEQLLEGRDGGVAVPRQGSLLGGLFESLIALNLRVYAQANEAQVRHLRTRGGDREVDFIVVAPDGGFVAIEVKLSATVSDRDVAHLLWLSQQTGALCRDLVLITTGEYAYRRPDGVAVVPAALLGP